MDGWWILIEFNFIDFIFHAPDNGFLINTVPKTFYIVNSPDCTLKKFKGRNYLSIRKFPIVIFE